MATVAPCAYYGCGCGQPGHIAAFQQSGMAYPTYAHQDPPVKLRLRRLLLELKPLEEKYWEAQQLVQQMAVHEVGLWVQAILEKPLPMQWMHNLSIHILGELLQRHPAIVTSEFGKVRKNVSWLFPEDGDVDRAAAFFRNLLWTKETMGQNTKSEASTFSKLLMKRTKQNDLCKVPACTGRAWLVHIWKDVPSTRPSLDLLVSCVVRWLADPYETQGAKAACLKVLSEETARLRPPADLETWIISLLFQEVCRHPMQHSPDLQQLLCLLHVPPHPSSVRCLLGSSQDPGYLMTLWGCLCNWLPQAPWMSGQACEAWCRAGPPPLYALLRAMLVAFSQLPDSRNLCRSAIMALAALGTSSSSISTQAPALLLMLFHDGPVLPAEVWMPLLPLLDYLSQFSEQAVELGTRLRSLASGGFWTAPRLGGQMASPPNGQMQAHLATFQTAPGATWSQCEQNQIGIHQCHQAHGQGWPQEYQTCHPAPPKQAQGAQGCMQPFTTQTEFHTLPEQTSKAVTHRQPSVGLQNTNNTCYMNSFMQALFLTDAFVWRIYDFTLKLKAKASKIDEEDFEFGKKVVELLQKQFAKMALTKHQHTDIWDILQAFPADYRSGEQQDVTETIRFVFDKLGGSDQDLLREVFAGQLQEKIQCRECGKIKVREETFTDLVLPVPTAEQAKESGIVPTMQKLLEERLKCEEMDDPNNLVTCENCQKKTFAVKWSEITRPPPHLCLCLNRFTFNMQTYDFTKEKTPVKIDEGLWIGGYEYELYHTIIHTGKDASSGHYYAMGRRSEPTVSGDCAFYTMDDSQIKEADVSLLAGNPPEKLLDDNAYVLFLRCKQAPPTPEFRIPLSLVEYVKKQDKKQ